MAHLYPRPLKLPLSQSNSASQIHDSRPHLCHQRHHYDHCHHNHRHHHDHCHHHNQHLPITRAASVTSIPIWIFVPIPVVVPVPVNCNSQTLPESNTNQIEICISPKLHTLTNFNSSSLPTCRPSIYHRDSDRPCSKDHCPCICPFCSRGHLCTYNHTNIFKQLL